MNTASGRNSRSYKLPNFQPNFQFGSFSRARIPVCMRERKPNTLSFDQRLGLTVAHTAQALDCGATKVWGLIHKGLLDIAYVDGMPRVTADSVRRLLSQKTASGGRGAALTTKRLEKRTQDRV